MLLLSTEVLGGEIQFAAVNDIEPPILDIDSYYRNAQNRVNHECAALGLRAPRFESSYPLSSSLLPPLLADVLGFPVYGNA